MAYDEPRSQSGIQPETTQQGITDMGEEKKTARDISHVERVLSPDDDLKKDNMDLSRVDKEVSESFISITQA
jgi:hypothetical protein